MKIISAPSKNENYFILFRKYKMTSKIITIREFFNTDNTSGINGKDTFIIKSEINRVNVGYPTSHTATEITVSFKYGPEKVFKYDTVEDCLKEFMRILSELGKEFIFIKDRGYNILAKDDIYMVKLDNNNDQIEIYMKSYDCPIYFFFYDEEYPNVACNRTFININNSLSS